MPDSIVSARQLNIHMAVLGQRLIVLGDLVALRQIRIEVILARENSNGN
jgi:hypothetical protein